ncbi:low molecular weight protein-tyrosine-phosphatase [Tenacibaculum sp. SG-28]|uniref:low molecular weight protein-tyrosine-phosphatase n=1 Tax=Tenacibaculum sp. SG-28 TaxID=754426 RepID=UPI000CF49754|nr:low molecular weight protein-tyrosine-phosphatase [Tenacibaculum sp. SG-28]PQJ19885.1 protein-tyrosine-phosphatase [Tenacibaculum sp. SG-28]
MTKILMVCLGNICRSPLAEGILKSKLSNKLYQIDSAGTAGWHQGKQPDTRSIAVAKKNGIDISDQRSRKFSLSDFTNFDVIFAMDSNNYDDLIALSRNLEEASKVKMILDDVALTDKNVPDPYYGGEQRFEYVYSLLDSACSIIAEKYRNNER